MPTVGVVSPGAMGSAIGATLVRGGARVVATLAGRSERTARLSERSRIELLPDLAPVVGASDVILSIVPPEAARSVASTIAAAAEEQGARPLVVDLNAIAPATAREAAAIAARAGCDFVDGSISGPPPWRRDTTRVYVSGPRAAEVADLPFEGVDRIDVGPDVGSASAVKMSTASVYKGTSALLLQALVTARANGVLEHVLADLRRASPDLVTKVEKRLALAASKSGRYVGEMREIADTQAGAGLTPALFEAMAQVYADLSTTALARTSPEDAQDERSLDDVLDALRY